MSKEEIIALSFEENHSNTLLNASKSEDSGFLQRITVERIE